MAEPMTAARAAELLREHAASWRAGAQSQRDSGLLRFVDQADANAVACDAGADALGRVDDVEHDLEFSLQDRDRFIALVRLLLDAFAGLGGSRELMDRAEREARAAIAEWDAATANQTYGPPRLARQALEEMFAVAIAYRDIFREGPPDGVLDDPARAEAQVVHQARRARAAREALFVLLDELRRWQPWPTPAVLPATEVNGDG